MASDYPSTVDTFPAVSPSTPMDQSGSEHDLLHNDLADGIIAVQETLGVNPAGAHATVADRLDELDVGGAVNIATTEPLSPDPGVFFLDLDSAPPADSYLDLGNAGAAKTVNINDADVQKLVLNSTTCAITLTGDPAAGFVRRWELHLTHDATTNARAATWPADVEWVSGTAPTLANTANLVVVITFTTRSDGIHFGRFHGPYLL